MYSYQNSSTIFVSQKNGDDDWCNGLSPDREDYDNGPFKTVEKALRAVGELRASGNKRPMTIAFVDDYYTDSPVCVGQKYMSGQLGKHGCDGITFTSFGGRRRIVGGFMVKSWKEDTFNGVRCLSAKLPERKNGERWDFTDLYVNGKRASFTRYPASGTLKAVRTEYDKDSFCVHDFQHDLMSSSKWFDAFPADLKNIKGIEDAIVSYYHYWVDEHSPVESYDPETGRLTMQYASRFSITTSYDKNETHNLHYYLENLPGVFGAENEWYLDRIAGIVYYKPRAGVDIGNIEAYAPTAEKLFVIEGDAEKRIKDIRIRNLDLVCTKGDYTSDINIEPLTGEIWRGEKYGSDIQSVYLAEGAVTFRFAERCSVADCTIKNLGIHAIFVDRGCRNIRIERNIVDDIAAGGISIRGGAYGCEECYENYGNIIRGNKITWCGRRYAAGCGILVCHSHDNEISENEIAYLDYSGISVGWVWGYANSNTYGNLIRKNHIHHIGMGNLSDMGGIYTLGMQEGTVIEENVIHDILSSHYCANGIYPDEGSSFIDIERNVVYDAQSYCYHQHYGQQNVVKNNIFAFGGECVHVALNENHECALFERNIMITDGAAVYSSNRTMIHPQSQRDNFYYDISGKSPDMYCFKIENKKMSAEEWLEKIRPNEAGAVYSDPGVKDAAKRNFSMTDESAAVKKGFEKL